MKILKPLLLSLLYLLPAWGAGRQQVRYALLLGSNRGYADEVPLRYAEQDAARLAQVLTHLGSVPEENLILLQGRSAQDLSRVLKSLGARFAAAPEAESLLLVYFSGHADAQSLHLGSSSFSFEKLKAQLNATGARLKVLVVDACRAGELTRVKGAVPAEPFLIDVEDRLASEGSAIITSAAAGEDAQESDGLRGGIFSHHLVNGLLGAADASRDERVTLSEAYRYAYRETLKSTSRARFLQHPTYAFQIRGREDLVLTRLRDDEGLGRMSLGEAGRYMILAQGERGSVVELSSDGETQILLPPGPYLVRRRTESAIYEGEAEIQEGVQTHLRPGDLRQVPFGTTVRRGGGRGSAWGLSTALEFGSAPLPASEPSVGAALGLRLDLSALSLESRFRYSQSSAENSALSIEHESLGMDFAGLRFFDWGPLSPGLGLRVGFDFMRQRFEPQEEPERRALIGRLSPIARLEVSLSPQISVGLEGGVLILLAQHEGEEEPSLRAIPQTQLALQLYLD